MKLTCSCHCPSCVNNFEGTYGTCDFLVRVSLGHSQGPFTSGSGYEKQYTELEESKAALWCNHLWTTAENKAKKLNPEREAEEETRER